MTTALILNIALSGLVFAAIIGKLVWSIATQHHDRGVTVVSRPRRDRWAFPRPTRVGPADPRPQTALGSRGQAWPAA